MGTGVQDAAPTLKPHIPYRLYPLSSFSSEPQSPITKLPGNLPSFCLPLLMQAHWHPRFGRKKPRALKAAPLPGCAITQSPRSPRGSFFPVYLLPLLSNEEISTQLRCHIPGGRWLYSIGCKIPRNMDLAAHPVHREATES